MYFNLYSISASGVRLEFYVMNIAPPAVQLPSISISTRSNDIEPFQHISVLAGLWTLPPSHGWIFSLIRELGGGIGRTRIFWENFPFLGNSLLGFRHYNDFLAEYRPMLPPCLPQLAENQPYKQFTRADLLLMISSRLR